MKLVPHGNRDRDEGMINMYRSLTFLFLSHYRARKVCILAGVIFGYPVCIRGIDQVR